MAARKAAGDDAAEVTPLVVKEDGKVCDGNEGFFPAGTELSADLPDETIDSLKAKGLAE
jgi:hypothetical protein